MTVRESAQQLRTLLNNAGIPTSVDMTYSQLKYLADKNGLTATGTGGVGPQGPKGDKGDTGATGATGAQGIQGIQGLQGNAGTSATVAVGTVTTGAAGSSATVTNSGTSSAAVLDFAIPRGDTGASGSITTANTQVIVGTGTNTAAGQANLLFSTPNVLTLTTGGSDTPKIQIAKSTAALTMQCDNNGELHIDDGSNDGSGHGASIKLDSRAYSSSPAKIAANKQLALRAEYTSANQPILTICNSNGYIRVGCQNTSFAHFYTDRNSFYFNKPINLDGGSFISYNDDLSIVTDAAAPSSTPTTRIFIDSGVDECRVGIGAFSSSSLPATELEVAGTIRQSAVTSAIVHADANGDLGGLTVGSGLSLVGSTLSATGGGGGGATGMPLHSHDQSPSASLFSPFRLLANGNTLSLGSVNVFSPDTTGTGSRQIFTITSCGNVARCGTEHIFYGQDGDIGVADNVDYKLDTVSADGVKSMFITHMHQLTAVPFVEGYQSLIVKPQPANFMFGGTISSVRVIDAGLHSIIPMITDADGAPVGGEPPENPENVRILLVVTHGYVMSGGNLSPNFTFSDR